MPNFDKIGQMVAKILRFFRFFKMAAAAILDFQNRKFLFADGIWRAETHQCTKFCQKRSFRYGYIEIFRIFKMAAAAIWIFENVKFYSLLGSRVARRISMPNFVKLVNRCEDIKIFRFFKMAAAAILYFRNSEFLFDAGICGSQTHHCTKFCQNRSFHRGDIAIFPIFKMAAAAILDF